MTWKPVYDAEGKLSTVPATVAGTVTASQVKALSVFRYEINELV